MKVIIDRFEGSYAVCEKDNKQMINIPIASIPPEAREGTILIIKDGKITIDFEETNRRKAEIEELTKDLWQ
ncbi:hypothetical protein CLHOM_21590 [Clostridium homopropionicum DSM 5847]|uniref:Uncharacterized protein n=1 Tax=Clostridium homopropionicum DSM 5847 TaxID=1121318 RepID=A0A0L6Z9A8_9CLOT|nr:DUF3006 domain-containing protein [Clostridium homopropionicum]KOA19368.1 hypothetical protein CLHOM_21590 [Clostridium homopropionicum DSM 5847]SFG67676.1 Protein of unknown function [Clostridium homopropionicum]